MHARAIYYYTILYTPQSSVEKDQCHPPPPHHHHTQKASPNILVHLRVPHIKKHMDVFAKMCELCPGEHTLYSRRIMDSATDLAKNPEEEKNEMPTA